MTMHTRGHIQGAHVTRINIHSFTLLCLVTNHEPPCTVVRLAAGDQEAEFGQVGTCHDINFIIFLEL